MDCAATENAISSERAVRLFVGGQPGSVQGERANLTGDRCFTAAHPPMRADFDAREVTALLDSGAFTDPPNKRLTPEDALRRQLAWERRASEMWGTPWQARYIASYDLLIDETWVAGMRHKRRWTVGSADMAIAQTIEAAQYLAAQRDNLAPRTLVLGCQGVDAMQYRECVTEVLRVATPADWIGLGGWCILGRWTSWLPTFWATLYEVLPRIAGAGIKHVHIFGVLYEPALGGMLWLADHYSLTVSTDSAAPILAATRGNAKKAGLRAAYWLDNVEHWRATLANLRHSRYYKQPPQVAPARQLAMDFVA